MSSRTNSRTDVDQPPECRRRRFRSIGQRARRLRQVLEPLFRKASIICILIIVTLSTLPGGLRPHTGASGNFEHFLAYFGTGGMIVLGRPAIPKLPIGAALAALAALLEIAQIWIPGRSAGWDNFLASTSGELAGLFVVQALLSRLVDATPDR